MNLKEIIQYTQDLLVNDEELNPYLNEKMTQMYPDLRPETFETDEVSEEKYYGLRNELMLTILVRALGNLHSIKD